MGLDGLSPSVAFRHMCACTCDYAMQHSILISSPEFLVAIVVVHGSQA